VLTDKQTEAQDNWWKDKKYKSETIRMKYSKCKKVFMDIGEGLNYSNVYTVVAYLGGEIYLNISSEDKGYYSSEQAKYILENFLSNYHSDGFKWRNSSKSDDYAFATGIFKYKKNGYINKFVISVSLNYIDDTWLIDQIIIN
jgi:hypothetical protein